MNYIDKVRWLKEINNQDLDISFGNDLYAKIVDTEIEVFNIEKVMFKNIVHSVNNNLVILRFLDDMKLDFDFDDLIDYIEVKEMICFENIKRLCINADDLYYKDRIKLHYEYIRDNKEDSDYNNLALSILDNNVLKILNNTSNKDSKILKL